MKANLRMEECKNTGDARARSKLAMSCVETGLRKTLSKIVKIPTFNNRF